jgi:hypothetical protein
MMLLGFAGFGLVASRKRNAHHETKPPAGVAVSGS